MDSKETAVAESELDGKNLDISRSSETCGNAAQVRFEDADAVDDVDGLETETAATNSAGAAEVKKSRKKKRKSAGKRGIGKPTGMEEYYADGPLTPEEYEKDQKLYDVQIPFLDRLLTAMQCFEQTRKLTPERRDVFYKWLHYGGVVIQQRVGQGGVDEEGMDKDEVAASLSNISIPDDLRDDLESADSSEPLYAVDFLGCTQSFLARPAPVIYGLDNRGAVELITTTIERFLDYLLQHNVCPEYTDDIHHTRNFCRDSNAQMWSCAEAQRWLPGEFNVACSTLFGGSYSGGLNLSKQWSSAPEDQSTTFVGLTDAEADEILRLGVAGAGSQEVYLRFAQINEDGQEIKISKIIEGQGFEIIDISNPSAECRDLYKDHGKKYRPLGRVLARSWIDPDEPVEDLTETEKVAQQNHQAPSEKYVFFVEEIILQNLSVGQKVKARIWRLDCGIDFFDSFTRIYADFDLWLLNEMVEDYKYPRWLPGAYAPGAPGWKSDAEHDPHHERSTEDHTTHKVGHECVDALEDAMVQIELSA